MSQLRDVDLILTGITFFTRGTYWSAYVSDTCMLNVWMDLYITRYNMQNVRLYNHMIMYKQNYVYVHVQNRTTFTQQQKKQTTYSTKGRKAK